MLEAKAYEEIVDLLSRSALIAFRLPETVDAWRRRASTWPAMT
jgi:hypothetical protein